MNTVTAKVCIVGDFAVGKTSTIERYVSNHFSDRYLTTVGVKIDTKEVALPQHSSKLKLVIWDVAGTERFGALEFSYLRGAAGYLLVVDGTRATTLRSALNLKQQAEDRYGVLPCIGLVNKSDLRATWECSEPQLAELHGACTDVFETSAKTGDNVEAAIERLAERIAERELGA